MCLCGVLVSFGKEMTAGEGNCFQKRGSCLFFFFSCAMGESVADTVALQRFGHRSFPKRRWSERGRRAADWHE